MRTETPVIPDLCDMNEGEWDGHVRCARGVWTECTSWHWGEPPRCAYEEPDNSAEACERRLEWVRHDG